MDKPTIGLCMIAKNGRELLEDCLNSIAGAVDYIVVIIDGKSEDGCDDVARAFGAEVQYRELGFDFAAQRNYSFEVMRNKYDPDWLLWLDSDDTVPEGCANKLHKLVDEADKNDIDVYLLDYHYAFNESGEVATILKRERLLRASRSWKWEYEIHEVCIGDRDGEQPRACYDPEVFVVHHKHEVKDCFKDPNRNLRFIEKIIPKYEQENNGRMMFYAANEFMAAGRHEDAAVYYEKVVNFESEWREQRVLSCIRLASMAYEAGNYESVKKWALQSIDIDYRWSDPYCLLGDVAIIEEDWDRAVHFHSIAANMPLPTTVLLPYDPAKYTWYPLFRKHVALSSKGNYSEAIECLQEIVDKYRKDSKDLLARIADLREMEARDRRKGLSGIYVIDGNMDESHPTSNRHQLLAEILKISGLDVTKEKPSKTAELGGKIAVVFDASARISDPALERILQANTDIIIDFCGDPNTLRDERLIKAMSVAKLITTNSPYTLEHIRAINRRAKYIPDPCPMVKLDEVPAEKRSRETSDTIKVLIVSTDDQMVCAKILPLVKNCADKAGLNLDFAVLGSTDFSTDIYSQEKMAKHASESDIGICYFPRDEEWRGAEFLTTMMAYGLPVIASANSATVDVIDHRHNGFACYYPNEIQEALNTLMSDEKLRADMGRRAALKSRMFDSMAFTDTWSNMIDVRTNRLDVVIPCHGQVPFVEQCLKSIAANSEPTTRPILVVNPTSPEEVHAIEKAALRCPNATMIQQPTNRNFAKNCNSGIRVSTASCISLLNSDTIVTPGWDTELMATIAKKGACIVAAFSNGEYGWLHEKELFVGNDEEKIQLGPHHEMEEIAPHINGIYDLGRKIHEEQTGHMGKVEWVTFACVAMPRQIFMEVGELDDRFQNDSEDFDFCRRVRKMQGHCYYSYGSFVFHFCGVSRDAVDGGNSSIERQEMLGKNAAIRESKRQRENKTVRFYVGRSWEPWLPETVDETGIGGSETCVVNVARCLSQMGWNVEVFSTEERYPLFRDGVTYYPHTMFNPASPCDILIVCRKPEVFDLDLNAKLKILYNHDATYGGPPSPGQPAYQYPTEERLANMDYLFMLSRWHLEHFLEQYPHIPEEKMVLTQNGIDLRRFERHLQGFIPKDPKRFVYSSSGDRGLEALLQIWPMLKDLDPNFRLHLYYGLETWKKIAASRGDENTMARIEKVVKMSSQPGIVTHGRIGQRQLAQEFAMSNLWLYPTWFHETSCITAMEAMVTGNRPITTPLAALTETAITARFVEGDCTTEEYQQQFAQEIIDELNSPQSEIRIEGIKKTIKKYDWRKVVSLWDKMFINELEKIEKTKPKKRKPVNKETVHFVLPYGGSGGVQYPIELARSLNETDELRTKISIVKFANEDGDLSDILPKYDHIKTYEFDEFRLDPDLAFDCQHIVAVNWQTTLLLREMGANRRVDLKRYTMIQGDERAWAPMHHLSAQMSDQAWAKIYVSEYLRNAFQVPGPVIPNGFSIDQFTPDENSPQRDQKMIGCIIHQSPIKNTSIILDAIKDLEGDARLLSVVAAPELKGNQRIADVSYDVIWGPVSKSSIAEAMFRCGAWIVPSIEEGFGLVGLEAMAAGCILITASPGGMRTYVKPDENSIRVFNPKSKSQWANMIKAYLTGDPGEIATMRENARHTAEKFSLDVATEKFATFLLGGEVE